jgi:ABC-type Mn2+/Zn2+ transport system ATPase subunit
MNNDLRLLVRGRLEAEGLLSNTWSSLILAACDGKDALDAALQHRTTAEPAAGKAGAATRTGAYLTSLTVEGFRGIGPRQTLTLTPGPGLTIIVGRNGSGKSSFAEALEMLLTSDSKRWSDRSKIWREGWRNLHQAHPAAIDAELLLEGGAQVKVGCSWDAEAELDAQKVIAQVKGKPKTTLQALGWTDALVSYRPFLSYNELGSMLDEGPSKLYDALSLVLGLEDLVNAQTVLSQSRLERQKPFDLADDGRKELVEQLETLIAEEPDDRASTCLDALTSRNWGLDAVEKAVTGGAPPPTQDSAVLTRAVALDAGDPAIAGPAISALRAADLKLKAVAGSDADGARQVAALLESALAFHAAHGDADCPVCGGKKSLTSKWAKASRAEIDRLKIAASASDDAHRGAEAARRKAIDMLPAPPKLLAQLFEIGVDGLADARTHWDKWHAGFTIRDLAELANHIEIHHEDFFDAVDVLKVAAAAELKRREDRWRPIASSIAGWIDLARKARERADDIPRIKEAEKWLKDTSSDIRNQRFAPIADKAMVTWEHLRQQSNVTLGKIELVGTGTKRKVSLDVTVDGVAGAALGVMSQGELHSLALSLFLPRATLEESPFRFVVIDDPVQSMDPARVDGLARALEETAATRQVIVFTHDERLPEAVRRLNIKSKVLMVTRRHKSVVEVRTSLDPVKANIEDALALFHTTDLPSTVLRRIVPGYCRAALEAAFIGVVRRRLLAAGRPYNDVDDVLKKGSKLTPLAALAFFDDRERGGDVMSRLNKYGGWAGDAFKQCNEGTHKEYAGDLQQLINHTGDLAERIQALA